MFTISSNYHQLFRLFGILIQLFFHHNPKLIGKIPCTLREPTFPFMGISDGVDIGTECEVTGQAEVDGFFLRDLWSNIVARQLSRATELIWQPTVYKRGRLGGPRRWRGGKCRVVEGEPKPQAERGCGLHVFYLSLERSRFIKCLVCTICILIIFKHARFQGRDV